MAEVLREESMAEMDRRKWALPLFNVSVIECNEFLFQDFQKLTFKTKGFDGPDL